MTKVTIYDFIFIIIGFSFGILITYIFNEPEIIIKTETIIETIKESCSPIEVICLHEKVE